MVLRYTNGGMVPRSIGPGRVLMHNHVRHTVNMPNGVKGFRAWTDTKPTPGFHKCGCGWSGLPHYSRMERGYRCETMKALELTEEDFSDEPTSQRPEVIPGIAGN